jgi:hypothetical protein
MSTTNYRNQRIFHVIPKSSEESRRINKIVGIPHSEDFVRNDNWGKVKG